RHLGGETHVLQMAPGGDLHGVHQELDGRGDDVLGAEFAEADRDFLDRVEAAVVDNLVEVEVAGVEIEGGRKGARRAPAFAEQLVEIGDTGAEGVAGHRVELALVHGEVDRAADDAARVV